jgi:predicted aldo/keto reductase-like oxidoreductase
MVYRNLGNTGLQVSCVSLGCEGFIGKDTMQVKRDFDYAIDCGVNFIDIYSSDPVLRTNIGEALKGRRESFIIQSHICSTWENGQYLRTRELDKVRCSFEEQIAQLQTSYIDVGMIHYVDNMSDLYKVLHGGIIDYALELKQNGIIRHIGMSSHNPEVAKAAVESGLIEVLMFSINPCYDMQPAGEDVEELWNDANYEHPLQNIDPQRESLYELCDRMGVGIDVMKVFGGGDLLSDDNSPFGKALTPVQCIEYAMTRPAVAAVMVGIHSLTELDKALLWCEASTQQKDYTKALTHLDKFSWKGHCMYCGHCAPCSSAIDIAMVNKLYNLTVAQGVIPETVADHYSILQHHASECIQCGECEKNCPFGVHIIESMKMAAERFGY